MRSFIKSHRKTESLGLDDLDLQQPPSIQNYSSPNTSPKLQSGQFSPSAKSSAYTSTKSSPKKLLTPIKNLFQSKNSSPVDLPKRKNIKDTFDLEPPRKSSFEKTRVVSSPVLKHATFTSAPSLVCPFNETPIQPENALKPAIVFNKISSRPQSIRENSWNDSKSNISGSNFETKLVSFKSPGGSSDQDSRSDDDSSDNVSQTSSQFSFIKDRKGGKNTSVKYYKTSSSLKPDMKLLAQETGYDEEDLQDYDFETNGFYDDDEEDDINYNHAFDDEDNVPYNITCDDEDGVQYSNACDDDAFDHESRYKKDDEVLDHESSYQNDDYGNNSISHVFTQEDMQYKGLTKHDEASTESSTFYDRNSGSTGISSQPFKFKSIRRGAKTTLMPLDITDSENLHHSRSLSFGKLDHNEEVSSDYDTQDLDDDFNNRIIIPLLTLSSVKHTSGITRNKHIPYITSQNPTKTFYLSYHGSIDGLDLSDVDSQNSETYDEDLLENYLEISAPSTEPTSTLHETFPQSPKVSELKDDHRQMDVGSPLLNGITIGSNLNHRSRSKIYLDSNENSMIAANRSFIHRLNKDKSVLLGNRNSKFKRLSHEGLKDSKFKYLQSFHSSISDLLNEKIVDKVIEFDHFSNTRHVNSLPENDKITAPQKRESILNSVHQIMSLLDTFDASKSLKPGNNQSNSSATSDSLNIEQKRNSILNMMSILNNTELKSLKPRENLLIEKADYNNRESIQNMMFTLSSISSEVKDDSTDSQHKRESIDSMMSALENLNAFETGSRNSQKARIKHRYSQEAKKFLKSNVSISDEGSNLDCKSNRYSWTEDEEIGNKNTNSLVSDDGQENMDEDILNEINLFPEDFDFDILSIDTQANINLDIPAFKRTKSYNNKPVLEARDGVYNSNRIQTPNKTVTFYNNKSLSFTDDITRVNSASSIRSNGLFARVNEELEEE